MAGEGVGFELRRPADVLMHLARETGGRTALGPVDRLATDVKVINSLGPRHCSAAEGCDAERSLRRYADAASEQNHTAAHCVSQGVIYKPLVWSAQGGCSREVEALVTRLSRLVETYEGIEAARVKADFLQRVSRILAVQATKAHARRRGWKEPASMDRGARDDLLQAARRQTTNGEDMEDDSTGTGDAAYDASSEDA